MPSQGKHETFLTLLMGAESINVFGVLQQCILQRFSNTRVNVQFNRKRGMLSFWKVGVAVNAALSCPGALALSYGT